MHWKLYPYVITVYFTPAWFHLFKKQHKTDQIMDPLESFFRELISCDGACCSWTRKFGGRRHIRTSGLCRERVRCVGPDHPCLQISGRTDRIRGLSDFRELFEHDCFCLFSLCCCVRKLRIYIFSPFHALFQSENLVGLWFESHGRKRCN